MIVVSHPPPLPLPFNKLSQNEKKSAFYNAEFMQNSDILMTYLTDMSFYWFELVNVV